MFKQSHFIALALVTRVCVACGGDKPEPSVKTTVLPLDVVEVQTDKPVFGDGEEPDNLGQVQSPVAASRGISPKGHSDLCLDAENGSQNPGTRIQLWACHLAANQQFLLRNGALTVFGDKCVSVANARNQDGSSVRLKPCDNAKVSQHWNRDGDMLRWADTDKCLDVTDGDYKDGTLLQIWTCDKGNANQQFATSQDATSPSSSPSVPTPAGTQLDLTKWNQATYAPGTFNHEQERYTNGNRNVSFAEDGTTTIVAKKENGQWTSARLTGSPVGSLPAYYEATVTCPKGKGTWPAFWLTARGAWPQGGEIDIMEQINGNGQTHWSNHWGPHSGKPTFNTHESMSGLDLNKPHRYGGWITKDGVQFYVDGKKVGKWVTYPAESNFAKIASEMVPIVNLAMGGDWPGSVPSSTGTQTMVVHRVTRASSPP